MRLNLHHEIAGAMLGAVATPALDVARIGALAPPERLTIHARTLRASLTAALASAYPAVQRLTGEGFFAYAAAQFIANHPPCDPIVARYGAAFADFLAGFSPAASLPWLADVARFEWKLHALSDDPKAATLDPSAIAGADDARFGWSGSADLFASRWAVDAIVAAQDALPAAIGEQTYFLLHAGDTAVAWRRIDHAEHVFLSDLRAGCALSAAIAEARAADRTFDFVNALRSACAEGCFTSITPFEDFPS